MSIHTILVAVDFSEESRHAIELAIELARTRGARLILLHVGEVATRPTGIPAEMRDTMVEYLQMVDAYVLAERRQLDELVTQISSQGITVSRVMCEGTPAKQIAAAANDLAADLVLTGTHGRTGLKRFFLGSVAERVVRLCATEVLVVRPSVDGVQGLRRVLVATDFSALAARALESAVALAAPGAVIDVLHCWYLAPLSYPYYAPTKSAEDLAASLRSAIAGDASKRGAELLAKYQKADCEMTFHTIEAAPAQGIQSWLEERDYDLVVTGSHGRRGASRLLLGSVAEMTVRHSPCSVLVVHESGDAPVA